MRCQHAAQGLVAQPDDPGLLGVSHAVVSELTPVAQRGALLALGTAIATSAGLWTRLSGEHNAPRFASPTRPARRRVIRRWVRQRCWQALVGGPSSGKTPALEWLRRPLRTVERVLAREGGAG
ncbi:MAG TPA: hypothetical protein VLL30_22540 [Reyranella sp.]|nr:hypothetical protein [Reyranella sp.]